MHNNKKYYLIFWLLVALAITPILIQCGAKSPKITTPKEHFGHNIGDDYWLPNYAPIVDYWKKLARESDRMALVEIGVTVEGRPMVMAIITSPENHKKLDHYKEISRRLALAEGITDNEARELASEGRAVVWIDGGLHANETIGAQHLIEMGYQMVSQNDPETVRILNDVIFLTTFTNPDGMDMVVNWYMRESEPTKRFMGGFHRLEQYYIGHRNNRDFYIVSQPETEAICRVLYREWFPQIVYNHHHHGPAGTVIATPPFRDPFNYNIDPLVIMGIDLVGPAMNGRFIAEGKPGATFRSGTNYQTWWNGGLRTTPYFHNMIGILTECSGDPTPIQIPFNLDIQLPRNDYPYPNRPYIAPQKWHFRQSVEYTITADRAVLDVASKHREDFLFNIYQMGRNSIERGSRDYVTITPKRIAAVKAAMTKDKAQPTVHGEERIRGYPLKYYEMLHDPAFRDARGYILPSDQVDFLTATKFVNALIKGGVFVHRATQSFEVTGKTYPEGSFVIKAAQAFRPHIRDMLEPQDYPDDIPCPGGLPRRPYDNVGYTLAYQMGVEFDRIFDGFDGSFEKIEGLAEPPAGKVTKPDASGFLLSHQINDAFIAINQLLASGEEVYWLKNPIKTEGKSFPAGTIYIMAKSATVSKLQKMAEEIGLNFIGVDSKPSGEAFRLKPVRIGLWDKYGGSTASGYVRWILEQFKFPFEVVFPPALDAGNLAEKYDVLIFVSGAIAEASGGRTEPPDPQNVPAEWRDKMGVVTESKTVPQLRQFLNDGGTILTIGSSTSLGYYIQLPIVNHLVEKGTGKPLPPEKHFVPSSILQVRVDNSNPLAYGLPPEKMDVFFNRSPVFRLKPGSAQKGIRKVAWFDNDKPLRSGWAWGQHYLDEGVAVIEADIGKGKLFLFGPEITNRAQAHGTYKFLFNGIYYGGTELVTF